MANVLTSIDIAVPPERVWELVTDLQRLGEWVSIHRNFPEPLPPRSGRAPGSAGGRVGGLAARADPATALPVAVEVELSVKGARRLEAICRAWARCRLVREVRYYAPPHVARAVSRAVSSVHAHDPIRVLSLEEALKDARIVRNAA
jgi:hypothetical protein